MIKDFYSPDSIIHRLVIRHFLIKRMRRKNPELYKKFIEQQQKGMEERKYWYL